MTPRRWLCAYLAALTVLAFVQAPLPLVLALLGACVAAGAQRWRILRRSLLATLPFSLSLSLGVLLVGLADGAIDGDWLALANLRVLAMAFLGAWFLARIDPLAALAGWPTATLAATLAIGQIRSFERILHDCRLAFASRNIVRPRLVDQRRQAAAQAIALLDKAQAQAQEVALAMRSRGGFDA